MRFALSVLILFLAVGCSSVVSYTNTSADSYASRGENCRFTINNRDPGSKYVQIGILDIIARSADLNGRPQGIPSSAGGFVKKIQKDVCIAGGDYVVPTVNGLGQYIKGTVYKRL